MRKKVIFGVLSILVSLNAFAGDFIGYVGPFNEYEFETHTLSIENCGRDTQQVLFSADKRGKYQIPRLELGRITYSFADGSEEVAYIGQRGTAYKNFVADLEKGDDRCLVSIGIEGKAAGINPGRSNQVFLQSWKK